MEIYAEYLFMENFITGILILLLTGKICGRKIRKRNLFEGGMLCGIYSFVLFFDNMGYIVSAFCKILFSIVVVINTYGVLTEKGVFQKGLLKRELRAGGRLLLTFYMTSFAMGGITIALMYFFSVPGAANNGSVYMAGISYINVVLGVALSYLLINAFAGLIRKRTAAERDYRSVTVEMGNQRWEFTALIDTANFLREPITGKPVAVISRTAAGELFKQCPQERFCVIPYRGIGSERGLLQGFWADCATIGDIRLERPVFALYDGDFDRKNKNEEYQILLHRELMEGGIAVDV